MVLGFNGSPRTSGDTAWAVEQILCGAREGGSETETLHAGKLKINPCKGCLRCVKLGKCVVHDKMPYKAIKAANTLVLGAPIYMGQMSAQAKSFTDRLFAQITPRFSPRFIEENAGKKLVLVFTQGNPDAYKFRTYIDYTAEMFGMLEFAVSDVVVITGTRKTPANKQSGLADRLREIGLHIVPQAFNFGLASGRRILSAKQTEVMS
jgi:multimeric flavodoxin WrbA